MWEEAWTTGGSKFLKQNWNESRSRRGRLLEATQPGASLLLQQSRGLNRLTWSLHLVFYQLVLCFEDLFLPTTSYPSPCKALFLHKNKWKGFGDIPYRCLALWPSVLCCERNFTKALCPSSTPFHDRTSQHCWNDRLSLSGVWRQTRLSWERNRKWNRKYGTLALYDDPLPLPSDWRGKWELHALRITVKSRFKLYKAKYYKYPKLHLIASSAERTDPWCSTNSKPSLEPW